MQYNKTHSAFYSKISIYDSTAVIYSVNFILNCQTKQLNIKQTTWVFVIAERFFFIRKQIHLRKLQAMDQKRREKEELKKYLVSIEIYQQTSMHTITFQLE